MTDDDLDLELDDEPARPAKRPAPRPTPPPKPAPAAQTAPTTPAPAGQAAEQRAKTAGLPRPGLFQRMADSVASHRPTWNVKTFLIILAALLLLVVIAENWAPVRFYFLGLRLELPKAIAFLVNAVIGAALMWLLVRRGRPGESAR